MEQTREDILSAKIDRHEKICGTCKHYVENRTSGLVKYRKHSGNCLKGKGIIDADSSCSLYESIF